MSAAQAAVLYTAEPLWAALFGWILLHEVLGVQGRIGGAMILAAAVMTQLPAMSFLQPTQKVEAEGMDTAHRVES